jgi:hypothetical protein
VADPDFADAVVDWLQPPHASREVVDGVAVFRPMHGNACEVRVEYVPENDLVTIYVGDDRIPVELCLSRPIVPEDVRLWVTARAEAVFDGRYVQERKALSDGRLVGIVGTFHLAGGDVRHVYRRRLGWFRRTRRLSVTFAPYE